ncbi:MAG: hypothetical protein WCA35_15530 [Kovacikia sp.]
MPLTKTDKERKTIIDKAHSGDTFYGALFQDSPTSATFTADYATNTLTSNTDFVNGSRIQVSNVGGGLPNGLAPTTTYRVIQASGSAPQSYKLSTEAAYNRATKTGTAISLENNGSGTHTITEQALAAADDLDVWARKEAVYNGSGRQSFTVGSASEGNPATTTTASMTFTPTTGDTPTITYRYFGVLRDAASTTGNSTGSLVGFEDFLTTQTITAAGKQFTYQVQF